MDIFVATVLTALLGAVGKLYLEVRTLIKDEADCRVKQAAQQAEITAQKDEIVALRLEVSALRQNAQAMHRENKGILKEIEQTVKKEPP